MAASFVHPSRTFSSTCISARKKARKLSNNLSRTFINQSKHTHSIHCTDIIRFLQDDADSGIVGHLGYSRRGLGGKVGLREKIKFHVTRICYCQANTCCATFQLTTDAYLRILLSNDASLNPGPFQCHLSIVVEQLLPIIEPYNVMPARNGVTLV